MPRSAAKASAWNSKRRLKTKIGYHTNITLTEYRPDCVVQLLGINRQHRNELVNIRISDGAYWVDVDVVNKSRIYFGGEMVKLFWPRPELPAWPRPSLL